MLPILKYRERILDAITSNQVTICIGETGSGKTTQLPQILHEAGFLKDGIIAITQPRRVATMAVAKRVSEEMDVTLGGEVGYSVRFDDFSSLSTKIKFMTDGILIRECLHNRMLEGFSGIILDEAHERSLYTDILFGLLRNILKVRTNLKLIISSATMNGERISKYFNDCPVLEIPGRSFPVEIYHSKMHQIMGNSGPLSPYVQSSVETVIRIHQEEVEGHVLVFLTGKEEIDQACEVIKERFRRFRLKDDLNLLVLPLYGSLQKSSQAKIFQRCPARTRKVIVATNIAETSLTVDGIKFVVDAGFVKQKVYNPSRGIENFVVIPISKVSAIQRAGRAGRTCAGKCFRLYSRQSYQEMMDETVPEIKRKNLINVVLHMKVLGIVDLLQFKFLDSPGKELILDALNNLYVIGALNIDGTVTELGKKLSMFPLDPRLSRVLLESAFLGCRREATIVVSMLSVDNIFMKNIPERKNYEARKKLKEDDLDKHGDILRLLYVYQEWKNHDKSRIWCYEHGFNRRSLLTADSVQFQLENIMKRIDFPLVSPQCISNLHLRLRQAFCAGFFMNSARKCSTENVYRSLSDDFKLVHIHPTSVFFSGDPPPLVIFYELVFTSKVFMQHISEVKSSWISKYMVKKLKNDQVYSLSHRKPQLNKARIEQLPESKKGCSKNNSRGLEIAAARERYLQRKRKR